MQEKRFIKKVVDKANGFTVKKNFFVSKKQDSQIEKKAGEEFASQSHYLRRLIDDDIQGNSDKEYIISQRIVVVISVMAVYSFVFSLAVVYLIRSGFFC